VHIKKNVAQLDWKKKIPIVRNVDVVVVGAGPAGWAAALAAARCDAKTILLERLGCVGGMATQGLVMPISSLRTSDNKDFPGLGLELTREMKGKYPGCVYDWGGEGIAFSVDELAFVMAEMLRKANVDIWLHTSLVDIDYYDKKSPYLIVHNKSGLLAIKPNVVIDCTGDADAVKMAGLEFRKGREDGAMQPVTVMFQLGGINVPVAETQINRAMPLDVLDTTWEEIKKIIPNDLEGFDGPHDFLPMPQGRLLFCKTAIEDEVIMNVTRVVNLDGTSGADVSYAEITARRQMMVLIELYKRFVPGFEKAKLIKSAPILGVRETRCICGGYTLTGEDVLKGSRFDDAIAFGSYPIDIHNPTGKGGQWQVPERTYYQVPYRCLIPNGSDNILVAGRCISADHYAMSSTRIMGTCISTGQAAGVAASIMAKKGISSRTVDIDFLRSQLRTIADFEDWLW